MSSGSSLSSLKLKSGKIGKAEFIVAAGLFPPYYPYWLYPDPIHFCAFDKHNC